MNDNTTSMENRDHYKKAKLQIQAMRRFIKSEFDVEDPFYTSDWFLWKFLNSQDFDIKRSKQAIYGYFDFKLRMEYNIKTRNATAGLLQFFKS